MEQTELRKIAEYMIQTGKKILSTLDGTPKKLERRSNPDVRRFIEWWCAEYEKRFKIKYHVLYGKDGATVLRLLATHPIEKLCEGAIRFLDSSEPFIQKNRTIGCFSTQIGNMLMPPVIKTAAEILSERYSNDRKRIR